MRLWLLGILQLGFVSSAMANVVGSDAQNFNPTTNGLDFVTVESSETLDPGLVNLGFFMNYAVNSLPNYEDQTTQERTDFRDTILSTDVNFGLGLTRNWDVGVSFPQILSASAEDNNNVVRGEIEQTGITEIRVNTKYRLTGNNEGGWAVSGGVNFNLIENNPFAGEDPGPTLNTQLIYDTTWKKWALGANIGYRFRQPGDQIETSIEPFENQFIASIAGSYLIQSWDSKLIAEIFSSFPAQNTDASTDRDVSSMEFIVGMKTDVTQSVAIHYGGGSEVYHGSMSPDWRVYAGVNWVLGPLFYEEEPTFYRVDPELKVIDNAFSLPPEKQERIVVRNLLFATNSADINQKFVPGLLRLAEHLNKKPGFKKLYVEGHTDSVGRAAYNLSLSRRRAEAVRNALISQANLPKEKVFAIGYGEARPIANNGNYQGRARNRRVEFRIER